MKKTRMNFLPDFVALGCVITLFILVLAVSGRADSQNGKIEPVPPDIPAIQWFLAVEGGLGETRIQTVLSAFEHVCGSRDDISVTIAAGTMERLTYQIASRDIPDIITATYRNPQIQYYLRPRLAKPLDLLYQESLPERDPITESMASWYSHSDGHLYGLVDYPAMEAPGFAPGVLMLARQDILNTLGLTSDAFQTKDGTIQTLKALRKRREGIIPAYFDLSSFQQMFGLRIEDPNGEYADPFFHPATLEAVKFFNTLFIEKLIPRDVFLLSDGQKHDKMRRGGIFVVTGTGWENSMRDLYKRSPASYFVGAGPVKGDSNEKPLFESLDNQGKWATFLPAKDTPCCPDSLLLELIADAGEALSSIHQEHKPNLLENSLNQAREHYEAYTFDTIPYRSQMVYPIGCQLETLGQQIEAVRQDAYHQMVFSPTGDDIDEIYLSACSTIEKLKETIIPLWENTCFQQAKELAGRESLYPAMQDASGQVIYHEKEMRPTT